MSDGANWKICLCARNAAALHLERQGKFSIAAEAPPATSPQEARRANSARRYRASASLSFPLAGVYKISVSFLVSHSSRNALQVMPGMT